MSDSKELKIDYASVMRQIENLKPGERCTYYIGFLAQDCGYNWEHIPFVEFCCRMVEKEKIVFVQEFIDTRKWKYIAYRPK